MTSHTLVVGTRGTIRQTVSVNDTAIALGSGDVDVLGTPRVVGLLEAAAVKATAGRVDQTHTTVGTRVDIRHRRPSNVGDTVVATAEIVAVDGPKVDFDVHLHDDRDASVILATGHHQRVVVARAQFGTT